MGAQVVEVFGKSERRVGKTAERILQRLAFLEPYLSQLPPPTPIMNQQYTEVKTVTMALA